MLVQTNEKAAIPSLMLSAVNRGEALQYNLTLTDAAKADSTG